MQSKTFVWVVLSLAAIGSFAKAQVTAPADLPQAARATVPVNARLNTNYGHLPLTFEANRGQTDAQVKFVSRGKGYSAFLTAGGMVLSLRPSGVVGAPKSSIAAARKSQPKNTVVQFKLVGAAQNAAVVGEDLQPGRVNYFLGNNPAKWHTSVPTYGQVRYKNVYPGIDLLYYGNHRQLEYDFAVSPKANAGLIKFEIQGASQLQLDEAGDLVLKTTNGDLHFEKPVVYQQSNSLRVPVAGGYVLEDATHVAFHVAEYDSSKPLVIDPVLLYSTYVGGSGDDDPTGIAVDSTGAVYISGFTDSSDFPLATLGALASDSTHVFVAKLDPTGSNLVYADYLGGNNSDYGYALTLDSSNNVYVTGSTGSSDFPVVSAYQAMYPGSFNGFVTKISASGASLLYSTYLGGNGSDQPAAIALDGSGDMVVGGNTTSTNFPVANAYQTAGAANAGGLTGNYGFLTKFSADGSSLIYSTYFGGSSNQALDCGGSPCWPEPYSAIYALAVDGSGNAYVTGATNTYDFPASETAYLATNTTQQNATIGFVSKFSSAGALAYSTYFYESSGSLTNVNAIAVDSLGSAYITGAALSDGTFPVTSSSICDPEAQTINCSYGFVTKFDATGSTLLYSTFLGVNNSANPVAIALDVNNDAYVLGSTSSSTFSNVNGIETYTDGNDSLLIEIDPTGSSQLFATYLGGSGDENAAALALDAQGNIYVTGNTDSSDLPVTPSAFQQIWGGNNDAFVMKIGPASAAAVTLTPIALTYSSQAIASTSQPQTVLLHNMGSAALTITSIAASQDFAETDNCSPSVAAASSCTLSVTFTPTASGQRNGSITIQDNASGSPHTISLSGQGTGPDVTLNPTSLSFSAQALGTTSTAKTVTITSAGSTALNISGIQTSGDFAQTNNCPAQLAVTLTCTINVTFTPTAAGTRTGNLTINDDAASGSQIATLTGVTAASSDFSVAASPTSDTVTAGSTATYHLTVTPVGGSFSSAVELACSGLPAETSCTFSPSSVTPGASAGTSTLSISTVASTAQALPLMPIGSTRAFAMWMQLPGVGFFGMFLLNGKTRGSKLRLSIVLAVIALGLISLTACAGGTGIGKVPQQGTASGSYTVTVTGTSGNLHHSVPVTLVVQ